MKGVTVDGVEIEVKFGERIIPNWSRATKRRLPVDSDDIHALALMRTEQLRSIFMTLCWEAGLTQQVIADVFNCKRRTVGDIIARETAFPSAPFLEAAPWQIIARDTLFARLRSSSIQEIRAIFMAFCQGAHLSQAETAKVFGLHRRAIHRARAFEVPDLSQSRKRRTPGEVATKPK
jgi:hypothetical protein